jgi:hypothetical protein
MTDQIQPTDRKINLETDAEQLGQCRYLYRSQEYILMGVASWQTLATQSGQSVRTAKKNMIELVEDGLIILLDGKDPSSGYLIRTDDREERKNPAWEGFDSE